jgi:hypothetical protein
VCTYCLSECLHVCIRAYVCQLLVFVCLCLCVCLCVPPTHTLRLWLVNPSATSLHHHRYALWVDSRSAGLQDVLSSLSCLLTMISYDGSPASYRRHSPTGTHGPLKHTHTHTHITYCKSPRSPEVTFREECL